MSNIASHTPSSRLDRMVTAVENSIMMLSYTTLIVLVGGEAVRRLVTGTQWVAGPEIALYAFVWLSWFAMAHNVHHNTHLSFTGFRERFSPRVRAGFEVLDCLLWYLVGAIVIYTSYNVVQQHIQFKQLIIGTNIPLAAASLAVPIGWAFTITRITQRLWHIVTTGQAPVITHVPDELPQA